MSSCPSCAHLHPIEDLGAPHVIRTCSSCGRQIALRPRGRHGIGIKIEKGDRFVMSLQISANPLKGTGQMFRPGLDWFAKLIFLENYVTREKDFTSLIDELLERCERFLRQSDLMRCGF
jgi:hypothetical protein